MTAIYPEKRGIGVNKAELVAVVDAALGEKTTVAESQALVQQIVDTIVRTVVAVDGS